MVPLPVVTRVWPLRSATLFTVSPFSTMYSTPSVLTQATSTAPLVFWYRVAARLAGTAAASMSPLTSRGTTSSAAPYMLKSTRSAASSAVSMLTRPMVVGPFRPATRRAVVSAEVSGLASSSTVETASVEADSAVDSATEDADAPQPARDAQSAKAATAERIRFSFMIFCSSLFGMLIETSLAFAAPLYYNK